MKESDEPVTQETITTSYTDIQAQVAGNQRRNTDVTFHLLTRIFKYAYKRAS